MSALGYTAKPQPHRSDLLWPELNGLSAASAAPTLPLASLVHLGPAFRGLLPAKGWAEPVGGGGSECRPLFQDRGLLQRLTLIHLTKPFSECRTVKLLPTESSFFPSLPAQVSNLEQGWKAFPGFSCTLPQKTFYMSNPILASASRGTQTDATIKSCICFLKKPFLWSAVLAEKISKSLGKENNHDFSMFLYIISSNRQWYNDCAFVLASNLNKQTYEILFERTVDSVGQNITKSDLFLFPSGISLFLHLLNLIKPRDEWLAMDKITINFH